MKIMSNTIQIIAKNLYFYVEHLQRLKKKEKVPYFKDFYISLKDMSEWYNPYSLLGYALNIISEEGFSECDILTSYIFDLENNLILPYQDVIENYSVLSKFRIKIKQMYSELESAKNKLKNGERQHLYKTGSDHPQIQLFNLGNKFQEYQENALNIFRAYIQKQRETIRNTIEFIEYKMAYHKACLDEINKNLDTFNSRLSAYHRAPVFGVPLKVHLEHINSEISVVIHDCVAWIMKNGIDEEGIFRLPGNKIKVEKLVT
ncbi:hypothetical protein HZS_7235 [Henneguya salminicola]|nr:hypothetical protein HZS_7235 [Henneguya salminicola]